MRSCFTAAAAALLLTGAAQADQILFTEDFTAPDNTPVPTLSGEVAGTFWEGNANVTVQNNAGRVNGSNEGAFAVFPATSLNADERYFLIQVDVADDGGDFGGGYAGVSPFTDGGDEFAFFYNTNGEPGANVKLAAGAAVLDSDVAPSTDLTTFTYRYDFVTGDSELYLGTFESGTLVAAARNDPTRAGRNFTRVRFQGNEEIIFDNLIVSTAGAAAVPEPTSVLAGGLGLAILLGRRRRA